MVDRPRPPRKKRSSDDDDDRPDYELDSPGPGVESPTPEAIPRTLDEVWQEALVEQSRDERRYSLRDLFVITGVVSCAMASKQILRIDGTAAMLGFGVLMGLLTLVVEPNPARTARIVWLTLLVLYFVFSALAIVNVR